ncbi:MAG: hypothetical protein ACJAXW_004068 [Candidatus Azotimanducaceae bacterium]|jgi:hypothetical protein
MILMPEIALFGAATALLLTLVNCLMIFSAKRGMAKQIAEIRIELDANLSANHGLARHIRDLQRGMPATASNDEVAQESADKTFTRESEALEETEERGTMSLAEKLGLSQSEAEIITHLRPRRGLKDRLRETA